MPFDILPTAGLAATAFARQTRFFLDKTSHRPSDQQWEAIRDLMDHMGLAAEGQLPEALYLSDIPAGTGKTTSIIAFAQTLMDSALHSDTGMIIFVNRIVEAADVAKQIGPEYRDRLCVITSREKAKRDPADRLGAHETADGAQVVIATQAALRGTLKSQADFGTAARFHYQGARRAVVLWDESFAYNRPAVLKATTAVKLSEAMARQSPEASIFLRRWSADVDEAADATLISVPDFEGMGVDFSRLADDVGDQDELVAAARAMEVISGDQGYVTRQGDATSLVTHFREIPTSVLPVIVTDASAGVNASYAQMGQKGKRIEWLKHGPKTYRNMTVRLVPIAASRSAFKDPRSTRGKELLELAVKYIESVPVAEPVLVIGYKGWFNMKGVEESNLELALRNRLKPEDSNRMGWLTYGNHTATNAFKDVRQVLLLGLNFIPRAAGHAASGAALELNLKNEHPTNEQIRDVQRGLLMDSTLQALLRGNARNGTDGDCGLMEAVIFQTKIAGMSEAEYHRCFPEAVLVYDRELLPERKLGGRLDELAAIVDRRLKAGETELTKPSLYAELGMSKGNFAAMVKRPEWQSHVASLGLRPQRLPGRVTGLKLIV